MAAALPAAGRGTSLLPAPSLRLGRRSASLCADAAAARDGVGQILKQRSLGVDITQHDWLIRPVCWENDRQRDANAVEFRQPAFNLRRGIRPVRTKRDNPMFFDEFEGVGRVQSKLLDNLTSRSPVRGEIDQHGLLVRQGNFDLLFGKRFPRKFEIGQREAVPKGTDCRRQHEGRAADDAFVLDV